MAVTAVGYSSGAFTTGVFSLTATPDGTIATGDWMVAVIVTGQSQVLTPPAGWTIPIAGNNMSLTGTLSTSVLVKKRVAGETSYTFPMSASTTSAKISLMWFRGAADAATWVFGAGRARSTTGSSFNNIANSLTTSADNTLALTISTERTTATEANISSMTGSTAWFFHAQVGSTQIETVAAGTRNWATSGAATDAVTIAYPNTQASNGWAVQVGIPPAYVPPAAHWSRWNGTVESLLAATKWNGTTESAIASTTPYMGSYHVSELLATSPFYIAHRGGGDNWPEHTMRSYSSAVNYGLKAIEISVNITSDAQMICHHDLTTTRMTGTTLTIASATAAALTALTNTAAFTDNPTQPREPIPLLTEVLAAYGQNHVLFIEAKTGGAWQADLRTLINSYVDSPTRVVWKAPITAGFTGAKASGYTTWGYLLQDDPAHADWNTLVSNPEVDMIGVHHSATDAYITNVVALATSLGKKVIMWEIHTIADRDRALGLGVAGMMTSNLRVVLPKYP